MKLSAAVITALLCWSAAARAQDQEVKLTVPLDWRHLPRTDPDMDVLMEARIPMGPTVLFQRWSTGSQSFSISFKGFGCTSMTSKDSMLSLKCQVPNGYYWLTKLPRKNANLQWVLTDAAP